MTVKTLQRYDVLLVFALALIIVLQTTAPTIYYLADSTEYTIGAKTLGIVHSPGYGLYLLIAHLFTYLPFGDIGYRVNLLSSLSLAIVATFTYPMLTRLTKDRLFALGGTLSVIWSFHIWVNGVAAEVYMPQLATLAACGWALVRLHRSEEKTWSAVLLVGGLYGIAIALNPISVFFAPGLAAALLMLRVPMLKNIAAGGLAILITILSLLYFPIRYSADPIYNVAGSYTVDGTFEHIDLTTLQGIWWLVSGRQFDSLFFSEGIFPSIEQLSELALIFWGNYLGLGLIIALMGLWVMFQRNWRLLVVWLILFVPYTFFFSTYGAGDRDTMLSPVLWLMSIPIAYSFSWFAEGTNQPIKILIALILPAILLVVNFRIVDASDTFYMKERAEFLIDAMPEDAIVFGSWIDTTMMQHMQIIEGQRQDLRVINLYYFDSDLWLEYLSTIVDGTKPIVLLSNVEQDTLQQLDSFYTLEQLPIDQQMLEALEIDYPPRLIQSTD